MRDEIIVQDIGEANKEQPTNEVVHIEPPPSEPIISNPQEPPQQEALQQQPPARKPRGHRKKNENAIVYSPDCQMSVAIHSLKYVHKKYCIASILNPSHPLIFTQQSGSIYCMSRKTDS